MNWCDIILQTGLWHVGCRKDGIDVLKRAASVGAAYPLQPNQGLTLGGPELTVSQGLAGWRELACSSFALETTASLYKLCPKL